MILNGWKEIAELLKVTEQQAMKLEKKAGLPVYRKLGNIFSTEDDIRSWLKKTPNQAPSEAELTHN